jgi:SAM-dependent methyltransferase
MIKQQCLKCGQPAAVLFRTKDYNRKLSDEWFTYYLCGACHLIFLQPIPDDLGRYYPKNYYEIPKSEAELAQRAHKLQRWKLDLVQRFAHGTRLLEIGPAYGLFSYLAKQAGFDVTGVEMDAGCCEFLRQVVRINVIQAADTLPELQKLGVFDVIVLWQVIEHLPEPWAVLTAAAEHLAPGGILVLDTPNPQAFQFHILGRYWTHVDAPRHVELIPAPLLTDYLHDAGLKPELLDATGWGSVGFNSYGWAFSFKNGFRGAWSGALAHLAGRVLTKLLIPIERSGWRGSTYTAVFRREV